MDKKSIVFFTAGYPFGKGDIFLDLEMKCAESRFDRILIVSCSKKIGEISQYLPRNAKILCLRETITKRRLLAT